MISPAIHGSNGPQDLLYSSPTPSHTRRPSWPPSFGFDSNFSNGSARSAAMSSIPFPSGQTASVRRAQNLRRESGDLPQPWMFTPDRQVYTLFSITSSRTHSTSHQLLVDDGEQILYVASPPTSRFPPTIPGSPSLNGRKRSTPSGYPFADDSSNCIYTASPKVHPSHVLTRTASFPPSPLSVPSSLRPSNPYPSNSSPWNGNGKSGSNAAIYSTSNSTGCLFSSSGSSGALLSLNQANLMLLQKVDSSLISPVSGSRSRRSSHGRTSSLESISEEDEE